MEVLNLISDHENIAELIDSYEDPQHVHLVCSLTGRLATQCMSQACLSGRNADCACHLRSLKLKEKRQG